MPFRYAFIILLSLLPLTARAYVGGQPVAADDYAAKSTVILGWDTGQRCSAVLVSPTLILTAAHCVTEAPDGIVTSLRRWWKAEPQDQTIMPERLTVYFGNYNGNDWNQNLHVAVLAVERDPAYDGGIADLALVELAEPAPTGMTPAKMLSHSDVLVVKAPLRLVGFGISEIRAHLIRESFGVLHSFVASVEIPSDADKHIELFPTGATGMAAGDSGGPAFFDGGGEPLVAGIASGYDENGRPAFESVPANLNWLTEAASRLHSVLRF